MDCLAKKTSFFFRPYISSAAQRAGLRARLTPERLIPYGILLAIHILLAILFLTDRGPGTDAAVTGLPLDDAWIHLVYARSIAHTGLPYFNTGQLEAGFTSPVWIGVLAIAEYVARFLPITVVLLIKFMGVFCAWLGSVAMYELVRHLSNHRISALLGGALVAAWPALAFAQLSGMEVCLATALSLWTVFFFLKDRLWLTGVLLAVGYLTRPELAVLTIVVVAAYLITSTDKPRRKRMTEIAQLLSPLAVAAVIWSIYCFVVSEHLLPNTFYAKYSGASSMQSLINVLVGVVWKMPVMSVLAGVVAYLLGVFAMAKRKQPLRGVILAFPWVFLLSIAITREMPSMCGDYFYWLRYTLPALPFLVIPMAVGVAFLWQQARETAVAKSSARMLQAAAAVLAVLLCVKYPSAIAEKKSQYAWNCQNINEVQVNFGKWAKRNLPKNAVVLVNDAGAIPYFGERRAIDVVGLNDHSLLFDMGLHARISSDPDALAAYMRAQGADYLIVFPMWFPDLINSERFQRNFVPVTHFDSANYTITSFPQGMMYAFSLRRS